MVDTVGNKLRRARALRQLSLEDASRATKIRAARLSDLESDVYTNFANIAYAKGFLTSYAKYLNVDVRPHLDAFESTSTFGLDDYQYLSEKPVGIYRAQRRPQRRVHRRRNLLALAAVALLCATGVTGWFLYVSYQRLGGDKGLSRLAASQEERDHGGAPVVQDAPAPGAAASSSSAPTPATVIDAPAPPAAASPAPGLTLPAIEEDGAVQLTAADGPSFLLLNRILLPWPASVPAAFTLAADHRGNLAAAPSALALPREAAARAPLTVGPERAAASAKPAAPAQEGILLPSKSTSAAPDQRYYVHAPGSLDIAQPVPANADKKSLD